MDESGAAPAKINRFEEGRGKEKKRDLLGVVKNPCSLLTSRGCTRKFEMQAVAESALHRAEIRVIYSEESDRSITPSISRVQKCSSYSENNLKIGNSDFHGNIGS